MSVVFALVSGIAAILMLVGPQLDWTRRRLALQYDGEAKRIRAHVQLMRISGVTLVGVCVLSIVHIAFGRL